MADSTDSDELDVKHDEGEPNPPSGSPGGPGSLEEVLKTEKNPVKRFFKLLGPGLITGASDDDPSGIGTYTTAGASLGFATLWTAPLTFPLMLAVQYICAKVGMVSGMGLASVLRRNYSRKVLFPAVFALLIANTINAGADIGAIAAAINLFVPVPITVLVIPVALIILTLQIWGSYRLIARVFKWLALALFAYIGAAFLAHANWGEVFKATFVPPLRFDHQYLLAIVAILGTTISPYLFFWQASQEVEEEVRMGRYQLSQRKGASKAEMKYAAWDVGVGMFFCNIVFYFVIIAAAATLHKSGVTNIESATDAARALEPLAGKWAKILFAIGLMGAGLLAVPVLTGSSGYAMAEAFGWKCGLSEKPAKARQFYSVIVISTFVGLLINYVGISPIRALFWTAVINGLLAPPLLVLIMLVSNNKRVMGERTNGVGLNILGWAATAVMFAAAIGLFLTWGD